MRDKYLDFVNSPMGTHVARTLGLPTPEVLQRHRPQHAEFAGLIAIGAAPGAQCLPAVARTLAGLGVASVAHSDALDWLALASHHGLMSGRLEAAADDTSARGEHVGALLFDATGIVDSTQMDALYRFFHDTARTVAASGRVVVLGRTPHACEHPRAWTAQRALQGLTRSLGKELHRGITSNLLYVAAGVDDGLDATLRFFLSPRSAYVSGQVVHVDISVTGDSTPRFDWARPLNGKRALVTGAARGIGTAIAQVLAREGAQVIGLDVPQAQDALEATVRALDGIALSTDISSMDAPGQIADALADGIDIVVHNAGITRDKTIAKMTETAWHSVIDINLSAQERIDDVLLERGILREQGRIVAVSSISGIAGNRGQTNYATSKAGVIGRVQSLAPHLRARGITINAVAPGFIETQMSATIPFAIREAGRRMNSMNQGGLPIDVAEAIAWFAHPGASGVTGNVLRVCGQSLIGA
jgi:3-oxoacyl-[acyl-carrier protein] reductase